VTGIIAYARRWLGQPYAWPAPDGDDLGCADFDCADFANAVHGSLVHRDGRHE
jgi:cell wall-associated NlpC family hydrolase